MKDTHIPELDGIRAISILLVLATHLLPLGPARFQINSMTGLMGMSLFFCLSGFLITRMLFENPDVRTFLIRRIARIYPLLTVYAVLVVGLVLGRWDATAGIILAYVNYDDTILFNGTAHLWSICVEVHFYFGIALAVLILGRRGFWLVPVAGVIVLVAQVVTGTHVSIRTHMRVGEILSGSLLALIWLHRHHPWADAFRRTVMVGFVPLVVIWMLSCHEAGGPMNYLRAHLAMVVVGSVLFMAEGPVRRICRYGALRYIAGISYALYIWHPMTALGWLGSGGGWERYLIKRPISFALTFLLAHVSTSTLEAWFIRLARRGSRS